MAVLSKAIGYVLVPVPGNGFNDIRNLFLREERDRVGAEEVIGEFGADHEFFQSVNPAEFEKMKIERCRVAAVFSHPFIRLARFLRSNVITKNQLLEHVFGDIPTAEQLREYVANTDRNDLPNGLKPQSVFLKPWENHLTDILELERIQVDLPKFAFTIFGPNRITESALLKINDFNSSSFSGYSTVKIFDFFSDYYREDLELLDRLAAK